MRLLAACALAFTAGCAPAWEPVKASFPVHAADVTSPEASAADARVTVHLEPERAPHLEVRDRSGQWTTACEAPCDRALPRAATYRLRAEGVGEPVPFTLARVQGAEVDLRQSEGGTLQAVLGGTLIAGAVPLSLYGALATACSSSGCVGDTGPHGGGASPSFSPSLGPTLLALSGLSLGLGLWLVLTTHRSRVEQRASAEPASAPRAPSFRERTAMEKAYAKPTVVPILSGTF